MWPPTDEPDNYAPCTPGQLLGHGYQYWALGHIHDRREIVPDGPCRIVFPGNIQGRHVNEPGGIAWNESG